MYQRTTNLTTTLLIQNIQRYQTNLLDLVPLDWDEPNDTDLVEMLTQIEKENSALTQTNDNSKTINVSNVSNIANCPKLPAMYFPNSTVTIIITLKTNNTLWFDKVKSEKSMSKWHKKY